MNTYQATNGTMTLFIQADTSKDAAKEFARHDKRNDVSEVEVSQWDGNEWTTPEYFRVANA